MSVGFARPDVANLVFQVFDRSLHPELFAVYAQAEIRQPRYAAAMHISDAGHVLSFRHAGRIVTEVTAAREMPLPQRKRMLSHKLRGHRHESLTLDGGIQYHVSFQLEQLDPEVFLHFQQELLLDSYRGQIAHRFGTHNRLAPAPLSFLQVESAADSLLVHAFHTFPDNFAVVKVQSLFEM